MADFTPKKIADISQLNKGKEYVNGVDIPDADDWNKVIESQLWIQKLGENPVSVNGITGTPSARIGTMPDGTPHLVLNNIQGAAGRGITNVTASQNEGAKYTVCTFYFTDGTNEQVSIPWGKDGTAVMTTKGTFDVGTTQIPFTLINIPQSRNGKVIVGDLLLAPDGKIYSVKSYDTLWAYVKEEFSIKGAKGDEGATIASVVVRYGWNSSGTIPPQAFYNDMPTVPQGAFLWTMIGIAYTDNRPEDIYYVSAYQGKDGEAGAQGKSITISETSITYQASNNGFNIPTGTWVDHVPIVQKGQYLWTRTMVTYSTGDTTTAYSVSYQPLDGLNGESIYITEFSHAYCNSTSGETPPDESANWEPTANPVQGQYTWGKAHVIFNRGAGLTFAGETDVYSVAYNGIDGQKGDTGADGNTPVTTRTSTTYQNSTSGTTVPTGTWTTSPNPVKGQYLWSKTVTTWSTGGLTINYAVAYEGKDGTTPDLSNYATKTYVDTAISNAITTTLNTAV